MANVFKSIINFLAFKSVRALNNLKPISSNESSLRPRSRVGSIKKVYKCLEITRFYRIFLGVPIASFLGC